MLKNLLLIHVTFIIFFFNSNSFGLENKILFKIENEIITSLDLNNEYKYLIALNPNLKNSKKEEVINFSKRSIIQEKIKKIEIEKNFTNPEIPQKFLDNVLRNVYSKIGLNNLDEFKKYLTSKNIDYRNVKEKLIIESLWNQLIIIKFSSKIKINEKNFKERINDNKYIKSYLLSEIFFEVSNLNELDDKYLEISNVIKNRGFDFAALKYSLSTTSNLAGKLDWINENSLNKNIKLAIEILEINEFTKPIIVSGGFLILQINDIKKTRIEIDEDKEFKKLINYEKNNQLNQYSTIYFNKIKKDLVISEL
ncbi:peptidylprolyl isomerase [Candidatus Pelagibacter sp.]|nr:peptidylprolyl isomerase [Candidatus Pelagibacter sp.]